MDPGQNGLPVLPMTFSLEAMAEAAALLVPGKVVAAIRDIRLYRWLPFDPEPTTLEVRAAVASVDPQTGVVEVRADVRDLGNTFARDGANKPASEAVVVLADRYPEPPGPLPFRLTDEQEAHPHRDGKAEPVEQRAPRQVAARDRAGAEGAEGRGAPQRVRRRARHLRSILSQPGLDRPEAIGNHKRSYI